MDTSIIVWITITSAALLVILVRLMRSFSSEIRRRHIRMLEIGRESEEIYIPGDLKPGDDGDFD